MFSNKILSHQALSKGISLFPLSRYRRSYRRSPWVGFKNHRHTKPAAVAAMAMKCRTVSPSKQRASNGKPTLPTLIELELDFSDHEDRTGLFRPRE